MAHHAAYLRQPAMRPFFRILRFARPYRGLAALNVVLNLLSTIFHLGSLLVFIPFLRLLFGKVAPAGPRPPLEFSKDGLAAWYNWQMADYIAVHGQVGALVFICFSVMALFFLKNLFRWMALATIGVVRNRTVHDIRRDVYAKILELPLQYHGGERKGDIMARITSDVQEVEFSILNWVEMVFREPVTVALSLALMLLISPQLTLIALLLLPISGLVIGRIGKSLRRRSMRGQRKNADLMSLVEETLGGMRVIKAFNAEERMSDRFARENELLTRIATSVLRRRDLASPLSEFLGACVMVALVYFGGRLVLGEEATLNGEEFLGYIIVFSQLLAPVEGLTTGYYNIQKGSASAQRIFDLLAVENSVREKTGAIMLQGFEDRITYEGVGFAYGETPVLQDIRITIPKGRSVALVGTSGSGKTTLANLLPRFFDVTAGAVLLDGHDIRDVRITDLRALMGIVTQDSILFNDTVANNIAFGTPGVAQADIERAARIANAHGFITQLENGYQTNIGDGGNRLSGGQKQRLAIARAVLKNPPILILDEATSALDTESERLVQEALYKMLEGRTSLVIAHRLSTIQHCDEICVMQQGRIIERGTHSELYEAGGQYRKLCDMQAFG
jgi:subfamily B ATP-binding cassette protein MsbA